VKSPNFTVFLLLGFYLSLFWFQRDAVGVFSGREPFLGIVAAFLPITLLLRGRFAQAFSLVGLTLVFGASMLVIWQLSFSIDGLRSMLSDPPIPVFMFLFLLLPGLFMVSELDAERLPHELSYWSGLRIFRPLIAVLAGRERLLRRMAAIRETCQLRGIALDSRFQHLCKFYVWIVPLVTATVCEAAYAHKYLEMLDSAHRFIPTRPKRPRLSPIQNIFFGLLILTWLIAVPRFARTWTAT
jgi:hypothetical protein